MVVSLKCRVRCSARTSRWERHPLHFFFGGVFVLFLIWNWEINKKGGSGRNTKLRICIVKSQFSGVVFVALFSLFDCLFLSFLSRCPSEISTVGGLVDYVSNGPLNTQCARRLLNRTPFENFLNFQTMDVRIRMFWNVNYGRSVMCSKVSLVTPGTCGDRNRTLSEKAQENREYESVNLCSNRAFSVVTFPEHCFVSLDTSHFFALSRCLLDIAICATPLLFLLEK